MFVASAHRDAFVGTRQFHCEPWNAQAVKNFAPTLVVDCAFLTRDLVATMSLDSYRKSNEMLTEAMLTAVGLDSVERAITVSSGAAVYPNDALSEPMEKNPYGWLKRQAESKLAHAAARAGKRAVIARAWSVSGAFVRKTSSYALSDMVNQARDGAIHIRADVPVFRRYVSVEDLLAVSLANAVTPGATVIDSGGQLLEMAELAAAVVRVVNPAATITRADLGVGEADRYFSDSTSWNEACSRARFVPHDLDGQIAVTLAGQLATEAIATD
jgi:nucleoside-diphosphate-sugar epimerase